MDPLNQNEGGAPCALPRRSVKPEQVAQPAPMMMMAGSLLLGWLVSLLPWRQWLQAPDILVLIIAFWCMHEPRRVGMIIAFAFGLLMDVHDSRVLGSTALSYSLTAYGVLVLHRRLERFDLWSQAMHVLPIFFGAQLVTIVIGAWIAGNWPGWQWAIGAVLTAALWPLVSGVLLFFQRSTEDGEAPSI